MTIRLYDLAAAEPNRRFSPYCWRTRMALAHKGLEVETIPWRYADKPTIARYASERVPVIVDGDRGVADSWRIANYLEDTYPERPSLFGGAVGRTLARFVNQWADNALHGAISRLVLMDVLHHLAPGDRAYFRASREQRLGATLESFGADRENYLRSFRQVLEPIRLTLAAQPFIGGQSPLYPDYIVFGSLQWPRAISRERLIDPVDPIERWREQMLDLYGGLGRSAPGYW